MLMYVAAGLEAFGLISSLVIGGHFTVAAVVRSAIGAAINVLLWLWMATANRAGKKWARITATVFFGIDCLFVLFLLVVLRLLLHLAAELGGPVPMLEVTSVLITLGSWVAGLVTIVLLWTRESSEYYATRSLR